MEFERALTRFLELNKKIKELNEISALLTWDLRTGAPARGISHRSDIIGSLSAEAFKIATGREMREHLKFLERDTNHSRLDYIQKIMVREAGREMNRYKKIPSSQYQAYVVLKTKSQAIWQTAKQKNDFKSLQPYLEQIVNTNRQFAELWGYENHPYDALLNWYEPGMTTERLNQIFSVLQKPVTNLLKQIKESDTSIPDDFLYQSVYDVKRQEVIIRKLLAAIGFDFQSGRLDQSEHPFTLAVAAPSDVRLTTKFCPDNFLFSLSAALHEGGHGIYEQNIDRELEGTILAQGASEGIHESQSRLYENMIGKSRAFWEAYYEEVKKTIPKQFDGIEKELFWKALNRVKLSPIRTEADELTYNLHILVRYEIEKGLIDGRYQVKDLLEIWNQKMREYLGIQPEKPAEGVLQDIHWAAGAFGYFPSYTLGNIYSAQFVHAIEKEIPDWQRQMAGGNVKPITLWLNENVHRYGKLLTPDEIMKKATGEQANPEYLINYLEEKYSGIYKLREVAQQNERK